MINQLMMGEHTRGMARQDGQTKKTARQRENFGFAAAFGEAGSRKADAADKDEPGMETIAQAAGSITSLQNRPLREEDTGERGQQTADSPEFIRQTAGRPETVPAMSKSIQGLAAGFLALEARTPAEAVVVPGGNVTVPAAALAPLQPETRQEAPFTAELAAAEWTVSPGLVSSSDAAAVRENTADLENDPAEELSTAQAVENTPLPVKKEKTDQGRHLGHDLQTEEGGELTGAKALGRGLARETQPVSQRAAASRTTAQESAEMQLALGEKLEKPQPAGGKMLAASAEIPAVSKMQPEIAAAQAAESSPAVQVADRVHEAVKHLRFHLQMKLQPEGLGQLSLKMAYQGGRLTLHILADTPQAQTILSQQMGELKSILESQHVLVDRMQVSLEKQEQPLWSNGGFHHFQEQGRQKGQNLNHRRFQPATNIHVEAGAVYYQPQYSQGILNDRA